MPVLYIRNENGEFVSIPALIGPAGEKGDKGEPGKDGSDASVTAENIKNALGYTPVNGQGGAEGQVAISDGNGGLVWLSQDAVALMVTEIQEETRLDYAVLDVMSLGE